MALPPPPLPLESRKPIECDGGPYCRAAQHIHGCFREGLVASATGDCSSRLQDSELDALRVRVGVLEGALRDDDDYLRFAIEVLEAAAPDRRVDEGHYANRALTYLHEIKRRRAVLAGGEAAPRKPSWGESTQPHSDPFRAAGGEAASQSWSEVADAELAAGLTKPLDVVLDEIDAEERLGGEAGKEKP